jgi:HlyD family secretion protein
VVGPDGKPTPVEIRLGITDGTSTEVLSGDLREQQQVIVGLGAGAEPPSRPPGGPRLL